MRQADPHARYRPTQPAYYFGGTEADDSTAPPSMPWPVDIKQRDDLARWEAEQAAPQPPRRFVCTEDHVEGRTARRAYGVDSRFPGAAAQPLAGNDTRQGMDVDWWVVVAIAVAAAILLVAYLAGALPTGPGGVL